MFSHLWGAEEVHEGGSGGVCIIICQSLRDQMQNLNESVEKKKIEVKMPLEIFFF